MSANTQKPAFSMPPIELRRARSFKVDSLCVVSTQNKKKFFFSPHPSDWDSIYEPLICQDKHYRFAITFSKLFFSSSLLFLTDRRGNRTKHRSRARHTIQRLSMSRKKKARARCASCLTQRCVCMIHNLLAKRSSEAKCLRLLRSRA